MRNANEIKVGIVFLIGLGIITTAYFYLRGVGLGADIYYVRLTGVAQISQGNDVRLQGVKIGQVQDVGFDPTNQQPILTLAVRRSRPPFALLQSYKYTIQSSGLVGENYVDIRGPYTPNTLIFRPNDQTQFIPGASQGGILALSNSDEIVKKLTRTLDGFNLTLDRLNQGVLSAQNQQKLVSTLAGVGKLTKDASQAFGPQGFRFSFGDPKAQATLTRTLRNTELASADAARAARNIEIAARGAGALSSGGQAIISDARGNLNTLFRDNRTQLRDLLGSLGKTSNNIAGLSESVAYVFQQGGFKENAQLAFGNLRRASENVAVATEGLRNLAADPQTNDNLKGTLTALRQSSESLRDTAKVVGGALADDPTGKTKGLISTLTSSAQNLEVVSKGISNIVGDPSVQTNLKGATENLAGTLAATRSASERINALLGGRKPRKTDDTSSTGAQNQTASSFATTGVTFTGRRLLDKNRSPAGRQNFGDLNFESELLGGPFRLGVDNIGEGNNVTAQTGKFIGKDKNIALRYGVYRSKLGAGVELRRGRLSVEGNLYDPNKGKYNVYGGVNLTPNLQLRAGIESFGGRPTPGIALRLSR